MNTADWIVVILLLLWAVAAAISISKQKKKGKCCGLSLIHISEPTRP